MRPTSPSSVRSLQPSSSILHRSAARSAPNPYLPLVPGNRWEYEGTFIDDDGEAVTETITVTVTGDTKLIDGVTCAVVTDVETEDDVVIESTDDWFAQDVDGNVWYCGEISRNFEVFGGDDPEEPELVDTEGSWKAGRERAKAGHFASCSARGRRRHSPGSLLRGRRGRDRDPQRDGNRGRPGRCMRPATA